MKTFIFKLLISLFFFYIFFEIAIGSRIDYFQEKINMFSDHNARIEMKEKLKNELKKAVEKENYFTEEERILISSFIKKLRKELELDLDESK